jgi:hypothetical protein
MDSGFRWAGETVRRFVPSETGVREGALRLTRVYAVGVGMAVCCLHTA